MIFEKRLLTLQNVPEEHHSKCPKSKLEVVTTELRAKLQRHVPGESMDGVKFQPLDQRIAARLKKSQANAFGRSLKTHADERSEVQQMTKTVLREYGDKVSNRNLFMSTSRGSFGRASIGSPIGSSVGSRGSHYGESLMNMTVQSSKGDLSLASPTTS